MFPRLRNAHVTVIALACAVAVAPARGDEPKQKLVQKVYAVADLVVPISDYIGSPLSMPVSGTTKAPCCPEFVDSGEFMCQQPENAPCCQANGCCQGASCCPNGACCPDGPCCAKAGCCAKPDMNWTAIAAPEWCRSEAVKSLKDEMLIKLITKTVCPKCWEDNGGNCTLAYMPIGMGLVVNAPADVQEQVANLLDELRRLNETEVAFDVKMVIVREGPTMTRTGLDFLADSQLAFLDDQHMRTFMHAIDGDPNAEVICAPKLTVFNGQRTSICCRDQRSFVTHVNTVTFAGQLIYVPVNEPMSFGYQFTVCPTVSADRRSVRCELKAEHSELASQQTPLYPVTSLITPVFEDGAHGKPMPFTQFIQQPNINHRCVEKSLAIPSGATAVLYAGKCEKEVPDEDDDGPCAPFFDWIYDLADLFSPPAEVPTVTEHLFVLVTPRVIVQHGEMAEAKPMPVGPVAEAPCCSKVRQCAAMADDPACVPVPAPPCCCAPGRCVAVVPPPACMPPPPPPQVVPQIQLDVAILCMDPASWDKPVTAAWADLSPKACENQCKVISPQDAGRFCNAMRSQGVGKVLGEPRLVTLDGRPATFLTGGLLRCMAGVCRCENADGSCATNFETKMVPLGTSMTFLPVLGTDGIFLQCDCELAAVGKHCRVTLESEGEEPRAETFALPPTKTVAKFAVSLPEAGRTFLMHCGRNAEGQDVMAMVTPHLLDPIPAAAFAPTPPMAAPCLPAPPSLLPTSYMVPPPCGPQLVTGQFGPSGELSPLGRMMAKYRQACADGDKEKAAAYADCCLMIDPTCFGK